jgi:hypothetical protein
MPDPTRGADRTKVLSVRFTAEEFDALSERAAEVGVGPSTLARTFVRQALAELTASTPAPAPAASRATALVARLAELHPADVGARVVALEWRTAED